MMAYKHLPPVPQEMHRDAFIATLVNLAGNAGISLSDRQAGLCHDHIDLLLRWNRTVNLTRITTWEDILVKHILDSIVPAQWLPKDGFALDVGTGAGFPGVPLKILHPGLRMVLLEAHRKKASFLRVLLSRLSLDSLRVLQERWENLQGMAHEPAKTYSLITMRAVRLEPAHLSALAENMLGKGGVFAFWAGPDSTPEWQRLLDSFHSERLIFEGAFPYSLPSISSPRHLLLWRRSC